MSLQDDIFDVAAALKGKPEAEAFDRITSRLAIEEQDNIELRKIIVSIKAGLRVLKDLFES